MPWRVKILEDLPIVKLDFFDVVDESQLNEAFQETVKMVLDHGLSKVLADASSMTGGHTLFDLYPLAVKLGSKKEFSQLKEAVILPDTPEAAESAKFWELACKNRGKQVRVFSEAQPAIAWLME